MLAQAHIIEFLSTVEIATLQRVNKEHRQKLKGCLKESIWKKRLPESVRARFWLYNTPLFKVQHQVRKILRIEDHSIQVYSTIHARISDGIGIDEFPLALDKVYEDIRKDIARTYLVSHSTQLQEELFRILVAIAYVKPSISYCQGMNFILAVLLRVIGSEEVTFWMFLGMLKKFDMECMFVPGVPDLALREYQLNHYLKLHLPALSTHFRKIGVTNGFFVCRWFMTLYSVYLPYDVLVGVWDCFFLQGWKVLIKVGISLFQSIEDELMVAELEEVSGVIRNTINSSNLDARALMASARQIHVSNAELKRLECQFYMDQTQIKLQSIEHTLGYSETEISAFRWARDEVENLDVGTRSDVKELQRRLEKIEGDLEW